jgi:Leucine-rich repeat (LRR) protein
LEHLIVSSCDLISLPSWLGELGALKVLSLDNNRLADLPESIAQLRRLTTLNLENNPLNPELAAAYAEGIDAVKSYLRAKTQEQVTLNEAKLILIGEGEVGRAACSARCAMILGSRAARPHMESKSRRSR